MAAERRRTDVPEVQSPGHENAATEGPRREQLDWESLNNAEFVPDPAPSNGDLRYRPDGAGGNEEAPEEDDDNPYQESDEALPDDREERAIGERNRSQDPSMRRD